MYLYILVTVLVCGLSLMIKENSIKGTNAYAFNKTLVLLIGFILFALSAARVAVGNDYWVYKLNFTEIAGGRDGKLAYEAGFKFIVRTLQIIFGNEAYLVIFAFFSFVTVFFFVRALETQSDWFVISLFLLLANGYYFSSLNTVRYYLAFAIALFSMRYVTDKRFTEFVVTILLAACIHKTVLIVIPVYLVCRLNWKPWFYGVIAAGASSLLLFKDFYRKLIFLVYPYYQGSAFDTGRVSWANILKSAAVLILALFFYKDAVKENKNNTFYFKLSLVAFIVFACCSFVPEYTRLGYYFASAQVFLVPSVLKHIKVKWLRVLSIITVILCYTGYFAFFLRSCYQINIRLLPYYSWFFMP